MPTGPQGEPVASLAERITQEDRGELVRLARHALERAVSGKREDPRLVARACQEQIFGAFVTIKDGSQLRGCIGVVDEPGSAAEHVARSARSSALEDPRFAPVEPHELPRLSLEVSLLSPLEPVPREGLPDAIEVGRDGLVVEGDGRRGLLLPQVATELGWSAEVFLRETCRKAGLDGDAWRRSASVYRFTALVFRE